MYKVMKVLPPKEEILRHCPMVEVQQQLYNEIVHRSRAAWKQSRDSLGLQMFLYSLHFEQVVREAQKNANTEEIAARKLLKNLLMELRKAANHPMLCRHFFSLDTVSCFSVSN